MAHLCEVGLTHALLLEDSRLALTQMFAILIDVCCGFPLSLPFNADVPPCDVLFIFSFTNQPITRRCIGLTYGEETL
jgi:hypothetical protein